MLSNVIRGTGALSKRMHRFHIDAYGNCNLLANRAELRLRSGSFQRGFRSHRIRLRLESPWNGSNSTHEHHADEEHSNHPVWRLQSASPRAASSTAASSRPTRTDLRCNLIAALLHGSYNTDFFPRELTLDEIHRLLDEMQHRIVCSI